MDIRFRFRRNSKARWEELNIVLGPGEPGIELGEDGSPDKLKIGDGFTPWNDLEYFVAGDGPVVGPVESGDLLLHVNDTTPHPVYDDGPDLVLLYQNAKV